MKNILVYMDYENIHNTLLMEERNLLRIGFFEKLRKWCENEKPRIVNTTAYCNFDIQELAESHHQTKLQEYGVETIHTSNKGKNFADLKISIDLMHELYTYNTIDGVILVSNDKDMTPLITEVKKYGKFIYLITAGTNYDNALLSFPDKHIKISEIEEIEVEELKIDSSNGDIVDNIRKFSEDKLEKFKNDNKKLPQISLDYYIKNSSSYFNIMTYEFINIIKGLVSEGKLFIYNYEYTNGSKTKSDFGVIEASMKEKYIEQKILEEKDIVKDYDFENEISKEYKKYAEKKAKKD